MEQRVLFKNGEQRGFLNLVKEKLNCVSLRGILQFGFKVPYSTLKNYYSEIVLLPKSFFIDLCYVSKINPDSLNVQYRDSNWGSRLGGERGMKTLQKRYSNKINEWRKLGQKRSPIFNKSFNLKSVKIPKLNEKLAEFIGIYLGDGTMTQYFISISGDKRYDFPYFNYIKDLVFEIFGIKSRISYCKNTNQLYLTVHSKLVCSFLRDEFKLQFGNKIRNSSSIPDLILNNKKFLLSCLRGLVDTDGYIGRRGRNGDQFCVDFTSHNEHLLYQVFDSTKKKGVFSFCYKNHCVCYPEIRLPRQHR